MTSRPLLPPPRRVAAPVTTAVAAEVTRAHHNCKLVVTIFFAAGKQAQRQCTQGLRRGQARGSETDQKSSESSTGRRNLRNRPRHSAGVAEADVTAVVATLVAAIRHPAIASFVTRKVTATAM